MTECYQKARELGRLILESEDSIRLSDAMAVYDQNPLAQKKMEEYKAFRKEMQNGMRSGDISQGEYTERACRLSEMTVELKKDTVVGSLIFAENEFNGFVNNVINILKLTITGDAMPENGCGGNCGGGCCESCQ